MSGTGLFFLRRTRIIAGFYPPQLFFGRVDLSPQRRGPGFFRLRSQALQSLILLLEFSSNGFQILFSLFHGLSASLKPDKGLMKSVSQKIHIGLIFIKRFKNAALFHGVVKNRLKLGVVFSIQGAELIGLDKPEIIEKFPELLLGEAAG